MGILQKILGQDGASIAKVDTNGSLQVVGPTDRTKTGYQSIVCEADAGAITGTKLNRSPFVCLHNRLQVGLDTILLDDSFQATAQNTTFWKAGANVLAFTYTAGYVNFNPTANTAAGSLVYQSYQHFAMRGNAGILVDLTGALTAVPPASNWQMEAGWFDCDASTQPFTPTDGVYFRVNNNGVYGVTNFGGSEQLTALLYPAASIGTANSTWHIAITEKYVEFWNGQTLLGTLNSVSGNGQICQNPSQPISIRVYQAGVASAGISLKMSDVTVTLGDINTSKPWPHQQCGMGLMAYQGQNGNTLGTTALYSNSLAPGTGAAMTNTTAALGTGLGGQFAALPTLAANTDGILCSYQNVNGTAGQSSRTLYITGVRIQSMVTTVLVGGPVQYFYSLAFGHTAVSMATAEGAAAKAPRRIALGCETYAAAAAVGTIGNASGTFMQFQSPIAINPGEFVAICAKNVGTVTTSGVIAFLVTFDGYFE